jgi:glucokinase
MTENSGTSLALGVDLGGTKLGLALVDRAGRVTRSERRATDAGGGPRPLVAELAAAARELIAGAPAAVGSLGVGFAGQVDARAGVVRSAPNLSGWEDFPLVEALGEAVGRPVALLNDVSATALAEHAVGAGRGVDDLVVVTLGTGVGGGVIAGGRLIEGAGGYGGELGHMTLVADGRPCRCPNRGCLEAYAGGWAIAERAREAVDEAPEAGRALLAAADGREEITAAAVARAARAGDPLARRLVAETGRLLGSGLVSLVHAFNPRRLILGGGVIDGLPELVAAAEAELRARAMAVFLEDLEILPAALGAEAGVVGAGLFAHRRFGEREKV